MKNGKKPTREQKLILRGHGLDPASWLVVKSQEKTITVVSRASLRRVGSKPRQRVLSREI